MGETYCHVSFKGRPSAEIAKVIRRDLPARHCLVSQASNGWVTVFDADADSNPGELASIAQAVCRACRCPALSLLVFDSDEIHYQIFDAEGNQVEANTDAAGKAWKPIRLAELAGPTVSMAQIKRRLRGRSEILLRTLGIPEYLCGYGDIIEHEETLGGFVHIAQADASGRSLTKQPAGAAAAPFHFPRCLHGDARGTKTAWAKVTRRAWQDGSWANVLAEMELVAIQTMPRPHYEQEWLHGDILHQEPQGMIGPSAKVKAWRLYRILELLSHSAKEDREMPVAERMARLRGLILTGMDHLWFTLGMLNDFEFGLLGGDDERLGQDTYRIIFQRFVDWLPEVEQLAMLDNTLGAALLRDPVPISSLNNWARTISKSAFCAGLVSVEEHFKIMGIQEGHITLEGYATLSAALLDLNVIESAGKRYRIKRFS